MLAAAIQGNRVIFQRVKKLGDRRFSRFEISAVDRV
jgi:hypothetical protein